jgi:hypothetical protein
MIFGPVSKPLSARLGFQDGFIGMEDPFLGCIVRGQGRKVQTSEQSILGILQGLEGIGRYITGAPGLLAISLIIRSQNPTLPSLAKCREGSAVCLRLPSVQPVRGMPVAWFALYVSSEMISQVSLHSVSDLLTHDETTNCA